MKELLYSELQDGDTFYPAGLPHRRLMQHCHPDGEAFAVTTESIGMLPPFRDDVQCVLVSRVGEDDYD